MGEELHYNQHPNSVYLPHHLHNMCRYHQQKLESSPSKELLNSCFINVIRQTTNPKVPRLPFSPRTLTIRHLETTAQQQGAMKLTERQVAS